MATFLANEMQLTLQGKWQRQEQETCWQTMPLIKQRYFNIIFNLLLGQQQQSGCDNEAHQIALSQNSSGMI